MTRKERVGEKLVKAGGTKGIIHVIPQQGKWAVRTMQKDPNVEFFDKDMAVTHAKKLLKSSDMTAVVVHTKSGAISNTYKK